MGFTLSGDKWWFRFNGQWLGWYRTSLFGSGRLSSRADVASFGGEAHNFGVFPPIGSGVFPDGGFGKAAYQRNIAVNPVGGSPVVATLMASGAITPLC